MEMMARLLFLMALAMALATTLNSAATPNEGKERLTTASSFDEPLSSEDGSPSARGMSRLHSQYNQTGFKTCHKYPKICYKPGSPGPHCCKHKCVNVETDMFNCGWCGKCCRYDQKCCNGRCVNVMWDPKNCGACGNKCKKGCSCTYGICDYA